MLVSNYNYIDLCNLIIGKIVNFKSDCQFFPNFNMTGRVLSITINYTNEFLIKIKTSNGKNYDIGSNMKNLTFEIIN